MGVPEILSRGGHDVEAIGKMMASGVVAAVRDLMQIVALLSLCALIDWQMALLVFGVYPIAFWPIGVGNA